MKPLGYQLIYLVTEKWKCCRLDLENLLVAAAANNLSSSP